MKSTGKAESVLAGPLDACFRLVQEDLTTFLSGTAEYWPCISFTSHCCWSTFHFCSTVSNAWLRPVNEILLGRVYRLNFDCFQVLFGDSKEFYLEKTKGKLASRHPFSKVCFQSSIPRYFLFKFKRKSDWIFKLLLNCLLNPRTYKGGGGGNVLPIRFFWVFFFLEDKTLPPHVFSSCLFISRADFETSLVMISSYGYKIWRHK